MKMMVKRMSIFSFIFLVGLLAADPAAADVCDGESDCEPLVLYHTDFEDGADGFVYRDDTFRDTRRGMYAHGEVLPDGGLDGSAGLHVKLGNVNGRDVYDGISGGWRINAVVDDTVAAEISLRYRVTTEGFDDDECGQAMVAQNGNVIWRSDELCGRGHDTGWQQVTIPLQNMPHDPFDITIGGFINQKTAASEIANFYFDDVTVTAASTPPQDSEQFCDDDVDNDGDGDIDCDDSDCDGALDCHALELLNANFEDGADGFVYVDDAFWGTNHGRYAHGEVLPDGGFEGSAGLYVKLGNVDGRDIFDDISGGWTTEFHLNEAADTKISLRYRVTNEGFDEDECSMVWIAVDGRVMKPEYFDGSPMYDPLCGRGHDTGWRQVSLTLSSQAAGNHSITIGGDINQKTAASEIANLYFDDVVVTVASTP